MQKNCNKIPQKSQNQITEQMQDLQDKFTLNDGKLLKRQKNVSMTPKNLRYKNSDKLNNTINSIENLQSKSNSFILNIDKNQNNCNRLNSNFNNKEKNDPNIFNDNKHNEILSPIFDKLNKLFNIKTSEKTLIFLAKLDKQLEKIYLNCDFNLGSQKQINFNNLNEINNQNLKYDFFQNDNKLKLDPFLNIINPHQKYSNIDEQNYVVNKEYRNKNVKSSLDQQYNSYNATNLFNRQNIVCDKIEKFKKTHVPSQKIVNTEIEVKKLKEQIGKQEKNTQYLISKNEELNKEFKKFKNDHEDLKKINKNLIHDNQVMQRELQNIKIEIK